MQQALIGGRAQLTPGQFYYRDLQNVFQFMEEAQDLDLDILLRIGPYICGACLCWLLTLDLS